MASKKKKKREREREKNGTRKRICVWVAFFVCFVFANEKGAVSMCVAV